MVTMKNLRHTYGMKVFTQDGEYFGEIEEAILTSTKVVSWKVSASSNSILQKLVNNAKGVIVPHQLVNSIGDIFIVSNAALPGKQ